jgi:hypothetical protein
VIVAIYIFSALATLPYFLKDKVTRCHDLDGNLMYQTESRWTGPSTTSNLLSMYMRWVWPFIAVFLPLTLLFFCNVRLIQGLRRVPTSTQRLRSTGQRVSTANSRITLTLIVVVFMSLILVTPSEILRLCNPYDLWGKPGHIVASVANALQTVNFAFNFILYCPLDVHFRKVFMHIVMGKCVKRQTSYSTTDLVLNFNQSAFSGRKLQYRFVRKSSTPRDRLYN